MTRSLGQKIAGRIRLHIADPIRQELRRRRNANRVYQPLFVAGAMGSGTTLLAFDLGQHFEVAGVVEESALQVSRRSFLRVPPISRHTSVEAYFRSLEPAASWSQDEARSWLQRMYRGRAVDEATTIVDKGPNANLVRASFFWNCFPEATFLLIFRDPVANIEGFRRKWPRFGSEPLAESIRFYRQIHERFLEAARQHSDKLLVLSYEGLVERHEETLQVISRHTGLTRRCSGWTPPVRANKPGQGIRNVGREGIGLVRDANASAYRRLDADTIREIRDQLDPLHRRMLTSVANDS